MTDMPRSALPAGFVPVLTSRFPLDRTLIPYVERLCGAALISAPELTGWGGRPFPAVPLLLDSGGYQALSPAVRVTEAGGLGGLLLADGRTLTPQAVWDAQHAVLDRHAPGGVVFTLDFPCRADLDDAERARLARLGRANAEWALAQPRRFPVFVCLQPGQDAGPYLKGAPDGVALGGLAPFSGNHALLEREVSRVRAQLPPGMPLHVFGIGAPESLRVVMRAGATSADSSRPQRMAASGVRPEGGAVLTDVAFYERLHLAVSHLMVSLRAAGEERPRPSLGSVLLTAPTGSGKTYQALGVCREVLEAGQGAKVLVLVPFRALAAQVADEWQSALPGEVVAHYTSDTRTKVRYDRASVIIMTPERLEMLLRRWSRHHSWLARLALVVCDEVHLMADGSRGSRLDGALTRLRALAPLAAVMAMSATVGDPQTLADWLGAEHRQGGPRPVPLHWHVRRVRRQTKGRGSVAASKWPLLLEAVRQFPDAVTLVFVNSRRRAEELALKLCAEGLAAAAFHSGLPPAVRAEATGRLQSGDLRVLIATSGVECGVNFPVEHVIVHDLTLYRTGGGVPLDAVNVWQRAGRAGRARGGPDGQVTLIASAREATDAYLGGVFAPLRSPLASEVATEDFLLGSVDAGMARTRAQALRLFARTFAAHAAGETAVTAATSALDDLIRLGGVAEVQDARGRASLEVTALGRVASAHLLPVAAVRRADLLDPDPSVFDVTLHLVSSVLYGETLNPRDDLDGAALLEALLQETPSARLDAGERYSAGVLFTAAVLYAACLHGDAEAAASFGVYAPDVTALRASAARVLSAWSAWRSDHVRLQLVWTMCAAGVDLCAATLVRVPGIGPVLARTLSRHGVEDLEALAGALPGDLAGVPGLRPARAGVLITEAERLVKTLGEDLTRERPALRRGDWVLDWRGGIDPVRLTRAVSLRVVPEAGAFRVSGGERPHQVSGSVSSGWTCDCEDHVRHRRCKHVLATELHLGVPEVRHDADLLSVSALGPAA